MSSGRRVNICFHGIGEPLREMEPGESDYWVTEDFFREVVAYLSEQPGASVSFDDGNVSDYEIGLPVLRERGMRGSFFPVAGRINKPGSLEGGQLKALLDAGMTVGTHGMRHRPWTGLGDDELIEELVTARDLIAAEAGARVSSAACPLGRYNRRVLTSLRKLGYAQVYTSDRATAPASAWLQPRFSVRSADTLAGVRALFEKPTRLSGAKAHARIAAKRWR